MRNIFAIGGTLAVVASAFTGCGSNLPAIAPAGDYRAPVVRYVPAPECVSDDGEIPAGFTVCTWNDGTGVPFVGSVPDADGVAQTINYSWDGVSPVMVGVES